MKGWRTLLFSMAVAAWGVAETFDWTTVLDNPQYAAIAVTVIGAIGAILRKLTNTPLGVKK